MAKIQHTILSWARETSGLSIEEAAKKLQITDGREKTAAEKLSDLEVGIKEPSRAMLLRMSKKYHRPLLTFYLDQPPTTGERGEDFRTLPDCLDKKDNAYIDVLIRDTKARQSTIREALIDEDEGVRLDFVGKYSIDDGIDVIVGEIREKLQVDLNEYRAQPDNKAAFKFLRQHVEASGIFVLQQGNLGSHHSNISVKTFRGFVLSDDIAPFIVINDRDAEAAWSFTLLHEMAHLLLGQTGLSGDSAELDIEKFCNDVASEVLLPEEEVTSFHVSNNDIKELEIIISNIAQKCKVSSSHIAYRLYRRNDINKTAWETLHQYFQDRWHDTRRAAKERDRKKIGGPDYYVVRRSKLGSLVGLVKRLTYSGALTTTEAGMLLDVKPLKVHRFFQDGQAA